MHRPLLLLLALLLATPAHAQAQNHNAKNVIVVTVDGFRWQDFFGGADEQLLDPKLGGVKNVNDLKARFWADTPQERRQKLLPFLWTTVAKDGQIFGDATRKSPTRVTNGLSFSYPGYSEIFCGLADPTINANAKKVNPNLNALEFLNEKPAFKDKVCAFCSWDLFPYILRTNTNGIKIHAAWTPIVDEPLSPRQKQINETMATLPKLWPDCTFDITPMEASLEHLRRHKPKAMYVGLGETDEWGHGRRYDLYLGAAHRADRFLAELWKFVQETPEYKDQTTLIVTTDHGRGPTRADWTDHGKKVPGAEFIWIAVIGPDTPPLGVRENVESTQSQVAATIARSVGEDFASASPKAAPPLPAFKK